MATEFEQAQRALAQAKRLRDAVAPVAAEVRPLSRVIDSELAANNLALRFRIHAFGGVVGGQM